MAPPAAVAAVLCEVCGVRVAAHAHYVLKMELYADPTPPAMTTEELEERDPGETMKELMEQMKGMSAAELEDQVHRRFEFRICPPCQRMFLANPLGLPRRARAGAN